MTFMVGLLAALLVFGVLAGAVLGWVSIWVLRSLRARLALVETELHRLRAVIGGAGTAQEPVEGAAAPARTPASDADADAAADAASQPSPRPENAVPAGAQPGSKPAGPGPSGAPSETASTGTGRASGAAGRPVHDAAAHWIARVLAGVQAHWMVALGGLSIGLAGVFLVRYSIEQGYLGPTARVLLGIATGVGLHALAEWLRQRVEGRYDALAALAGGASLTLYAAVLAALHLYALWPPVVVFGLLALISMGTLVLALRHGPVLAILGILGAFAVPALIGGEADQLLTVLLYSLIVAMASLVLMRYVYRDWLWWGTVAGALFWWWAALQAGQHTAGGLAEAWLGVYLAVLAWILLALRGRNYRLTRAYGPSAAAMPVGHGTGAWWHFAGTESGHLRAALLLLLAAQAYAIALNPHWALGPWIWLPLPAVILWASRFDERLRVLPWLALAAMSLGLVANLLSGWSLPPPFGYGRLGSWVATEAAHRGTVLQTLLLLAALFGGAGLWHLWARRDSALAASLAFVAPLVALLLAYLLVPEALPRWGLSAIGLLAGLMLGGLAARRLRAGTLDAIAFWQIAAGHVAYSLAAVIVFEQATLTLALAVQVLSLTWLMRRFEVRHLHWLVKLVLTLILLRLTFNPWLPAYDAGAHWTLWTYGGSLLLVWLSARLLADGEGLKRWLQAATLHLLVLFLHTQMRYGLYAGDVFAPRYDFLEAALNTGLWAALALLYYWRSALEPAARELYRTGAQLLMLLAVGNYLLLVTWMNPLWVPAHASMIAETPIFNVLLLAYGLPVLLWILAWRGYEPDLRPFFGWLAGLGLWLWVSLEIRHLWQGRLNLSDAMGMGELYSYSIAWLLMAVATMLVGTLRGQVAWYRGGLALLTLVILKIFFVDMGELTGLLRALSFMGLGLSLLGLAFAHQYLGRRAAGVPAS